MKYRDEIVKFTRAGSLIGAIIKLPNEMLGEVVGWSANISLNHGPFSRDWTEKMVPIHLIDVGEVLQVQVKHFNAMNQPCGTEQFFIRPGDCEVMYLKVETAVNKICNAIENITGKELIELFESHHNDDENDDPDEFRRSVDCRDVDGWSRW